MTKLVNRAKMTTATTGTGTITLGSAVDGFQTFANAGVANADVVRYVIEDGDAWEIGTGTYTASGTTLSRSPVESSIGGGAITLSGEAVVFVSATADDFDVDYADLQNVPSEFAPAPHTHGNITNDGKIGTTANRVITTETGGTLRALNAGSTSQYLRGDGNWGTPPNTTYNEISTTEIDAGTSTTRRTITGRRAGYMLGKKQDVLISGNNIKTINNESLLGSGNLGLQESLVSGTNIKTINDQSLLGSGNLEVPELIGPQGPTGPQGPQGEPGVGEGGVGTPTGGTAGQVLSKVSATDYDAAWSDSVHVGDTPPASPTNGSLWYDTQRSAMFVYYVGSSSSAWVALVDAAPSIPIEFVSQATATTPSFGPLPTHKAGDLLLMFAYRNNSNTRPGLPAGWQSVTNAGGLSNSMRIAFKIAESDSEASGFWSNATELNLHVYRNVSGVGASISRAGGNGTFLTYDGLTLKQTNGSSQVVVFGGHRSTNTSISTPLTGTVLRSNTTRTAGFDTDGGVTSWPQQTAEIGGTISGWVTASVELLASHPAIVDTLDFPASPDIGDTYTESGITFVWDGVVWSKVAEKEGLFAGRSWVEVPSLPDYTWVQNTSGDALVLKPNLEFRFGYAYYTNPSAPSFSGSTFHFFEISGFTQNSFDFVNVSVSGTGLVTIILPDGHYIYIYEFSPSMLELK